MAILWLLSPPIAPGSTTTRTSFPIGQQMTDCWPIKTCWIKTRTYFLSNHELVIIISDSRCEERIVQWIEEWSWVRNEDRLTELIMERLELGRNRPEREGCYLIYCEIGFGIDCYKSITESVIPVIAALRARWSNLIEFHSANIMTECAYVHDLEL
jgi:hypothetical protein